MSGGGPICLVHLVRERNGIEPFARFIDSYRRQDPGVEHELVMLYKGFGGPGALEAHRRLLSGLRFEEQLIADDGFDVDAYVGVAGQLRRARYCFVNSFSQARAPGWLAALDGALDRPGVGLAGATGSWASIFSYALYELRLPSAYAQVFPDHGRTRQLMQLVSADAGPVLPYHRRGIASLLAGARSALERLVGFAPYPARHVRTNSFALRAETLARLVVPRAGRKAQAHRLESGRAGITAQVEGMGLRPVLVGRDGVAYEPEDWPASETFWQGAQRNLLVADNQTEKYDGGDADVRELLSRFAWGTRARPANG
ncbi:MAG TPA: hypothetical protein VGD00_05875 [Solirubrobacteraceae bacterium]|jgi:hypothetical protein